MHFINMLGCVINVHMECTVFTDLQYIHVSNWMQFCIYSCLVHAAPLVLI